MDRQEFYVDYFDKEYLDSQHPDRKNAPHFQLADGDVGGTMWVGGDPHEQPSGHYQVISIPNDFPTLALEVLQYLRKPTSLTNTYQVKLSEKASQQIGETGKQVLEELLTLHNDHILRYARQEYYRGYGYGG